MKRMLEVIIHQPWENKNDLFLCFQLLYTSTMNYLFLAFLFILFLLLLFTVITGRVTGGIGRRILGKWTDPGGV